MKKVISIFLCSLYFAPALADYDQAVIKQGLTEQADNFGIEGWRESENGEAWIANTTVEGMILSVGRSNSGIIAALKNSEQAVATMVRCMMLGAIAMGPEDEEQRGKIGAVIQNAAQSQSEKSLRMNGVSFKVSPKEIGGNVILSCVLSPESEGE